MSSVPLDLALRALGRAALALVTLAPLVALVAFAEGNGSQGLVGAVWTGGALVLAGSVAAAATAVRRDGTLDAWTALGKAPAALLGPLLAAAIVLGGGALWLPPAGGGAFKVPAPVDARAELWWDGAAWGAAPGLHQQDPPGSLALPALLARLRADPPAGARCGVDRAELILRVGWAIGWLWAVAFGGWYGLRGPRRASASSVGPVTSAVASASAWLLLSAVAAAYSTT